MDSRLTRRGSGFALAVAIYSFMTLAPLAERDLQHGDSQYSGSQYNGSPVSTAIAVDNWLHATVAALANGWRELTGQMDGTPFQLYSALGGADVETVHHYYEAQGSDEVNRIFSAR